MAREFPSSHIPPEKTSGLEKIITLELDAHSSPPMTATDKTFYVAWANAAKWSRPFVGWAAPKWSEPEGLAIGGSLDPRRRVRRDQTCLQ